MGDTFKLALQLTMIDMLSGAASVARRNILGMGEAGKQVQRDFDLMTTHITRGLKAIAVVNFGLEKLKPGVAAAADLQDNLIDVRMSLMRSGKDAATLNRELVAIRSTAVDLQKITPFSASDVVKVQKELLNSGLDFNEVVGKGATRAAMMLATITKESPQAAAAAMLSVGIPYHLKSSEYGDVSDTIQRHVMSGRMKLPDLNAALPYVASVTKAFKVPWHDMLTGLAVLGEQGVVGSMAGTHLKDFYGRLTGASRISRRVLSTVNQDLSSKGKAPLEFWDKQGELLPTHQLIKNMRSSLGSYNTKQRMFILEKIFGEQGGDAALKLMSTGTGSWEFIKEKVDAVASAEDKVNERLKGFTANVTALGGTTKTTLATLFDPMLGPLTAATKMANDLVDAVGKLGDKHPALAKTVSYGLSAAVGAAGVYGLWNLGKGALAARRVWKGVGGLSGFLNAGKNGLGIAAGIPGAASMMGVQQVFVTNWPIGGIAAGSGLSPVSREFSKALPWAAIGGGVALTAAAAGIPLSMWYSDRAKENGWGSQTWSHNSREYEVMGIGGREVKNDIKIDLQIDSNGRVFSRSDSLNTNISTMRRGNFFGDMLVSH